MMYLLPGSNAVQVLSVIINVQGMQKTVCNRRQKNSNCAQKSNPAEQGIKGSKQFGSIGFHSVDRAHAGKDHAGIIEGIDPGKISKIFISYSADSR